MNKTVLILFTACVGLSLLSLHLVKQMRAGQATIVELQAQVAKLEQQRPQLPVFSAQRLGPAPTPQPEPVAPAPATPNKGALGLAVVKPEREVPIMGAVPSREERIRIMRESRERQRQLMQDPEYREAMRVQQRSNITRQYPGLGQELGLSQEQTEQLFDLLADQQLRNNDQAQLMMWDTEGVDPATVQQHQEKMSQQWMEIQRKNEAELAARLGPDKLRGWKEYQSTLAARHQAEQLRTTLAGRGVPLNEDASRAIVKAYAEAQKIEMQEYANLARANATSSSKSVVTMLTPRPGPTSETFERQLEITRKRNQRVLDAITPYLTYEQREALQKEQEAELKMQEAQLRMMRAQSNLDGNSDGFGTSNSVQAIIVPD